MTPQRTHPPRLNTAPMASVTLVAFLSSMMEALLDKLKQSPIATFGIILFGLEKLLALQFACPCDGLWSNRELTAAIFFIPTIMTFAIMLIIKEFELDRWSVVSLTSPGIIWLMLMFRDGRFFTCAMTDWEGRYVELDGADLQRWCEPNNSSFICLHDQNLEPLLGCMLKSQQFFVRSQWIGLGLLLYMCLILMLHLVRTVFDKETKAKQRIEEQGLRRTEEMKQIHINVDDVYDFILRKSGNNSTQSMPVASTQTIPVASSPPPVPVARKSQSMAVASKSQSPASYASSVVESKTQSSTAASNTQSSVVASKTQSSTAARNTQSSVVASKTQSSKAASKTQSSKAASNTQSSVVVSKTQSSPVASKRQSSKVASRLECRPSLELLLCDSTESEENTEEMLVDDSSDNDSNHIDTFPLLPTDDTASKTEKTKREKDSRV